MRLETHVVRFQLLTGLYPLLQTHWLGNLRQFPSCHSHDCGGCYEYSAHSIATPKLYRYIRSLDMYTTSLLQKLQSQLSFSGLIYRGNFAIIHDKSWVAPS